MNQRTKDVIIIPVVIATVTGALFMFWGAWYSGVKWHSPFSTYWLKLVLTAPVPMWFVLPVSVIAVFASWKGIRIWQRNSYLETQNSKSEDWETVASVLKIHKRQLEERIEAFESKEPKLHGVWMPTQSYWAHGLHGSEPATQVVGWIDISSSNTDENIFLLAGYINGRRAPVFGDVVVKPGVVNKGHIFMFFWPPLDTEDGKPLEISVVVEDQFNRKYELPPHDFRATPSGLPKPQAPPNAPKLHASWLTTSGWGWVGTALVDEGFRTYVIRGEVTFLLESAPETVHIVGVEMEGAKSIGDFENFDLIPGETVKRLMRMYFQGKVPENNDYYEATLIFRDIKGNKYPCSPHRFNPLPIPERVTLERHPSTAMIVPTVPRKNTT